jgi:hypothetical protein
MAFCSKFIKLFLLITYQHSLLAGLFRKEHERQYEVIHSENHNQNHYHFLQQQTDIEGMSLPPLLFNKHSFYANFLQWIGRKK